MEPHPRLSITLGFLLPACVALALLILPVFATNGDLRLNTGSSESTDTPEETPVPEATDTPVPPTATPAGESGASIQKDGCPDGMVLSTTLGVCVYASS